MLTGHTLALAGAVEKTLATHRGSIDEGYDSQREIFTMTIDEVLANLDAVVKEATEQGSIPLLPIGIER